MSEQNFETRQISDGFDVPADDPLAAEHRLLGELVAERPRRSFLYRYDRSILAATKTGKEILSLTKKEQTKLTEAVIAQQNRLHQLELELKTLVEASPENTALTESAEQVYETGRLMDYVLINLLRKTLPLNQRQIEALIDYFLVEARLTYSSQLSGVAKNLESFWEKHAPPDSLQASLSRLIERFSDHRDKEIQKYGKRLNLLLGLSPTNLIEPGEAWSDQALQDVPSNDKPWNDFLTHCTQSSASKPSQKWLKTADQFIDQIGWENVRGNLIRWFPLIDQPRTQPVELPSFRDIRGPRDLHPNDLIIEPHEDLLKGLAWSCIGKNDPEIARALSTLAILSYKKIRSSGPRSIKIGNAAVYALGEIGTPDAVAQLGILKTKVKTPRAAPKGIAKALQNAARKAGIDPSDLEEMSVLTYGLTEPGLRVETWGDFQAELRLDTGKPKLHWIKPDGKEQKSVPSAVKNDFQDELKELKRAVKEIEQSLSAQSARIEQCYLGQREWTYPVWRKRYHEHPLVATLSRRLIWQFKEGDESSSAIWSGEQFVDAGDNPVDWMTGKSTVSLWHPLFELETDVVAAWRDWLVDHEVRQPFKQAHREIYLLTDAERNTSVYSNRFAAHILKQHQFKALCAARNWQYSTQMIFDSSVAPPYLVLPAWDLRAEFWVEGITEDIGGHDSGSMFHLATDQVRFYQADAGEDDPLELDKIPALVFSEVMRDVDLFVGVCSVGNDPNWNDGGPEGRYRDYWQSYSFGELGNSAKTRKEVLEKVIPRLKIAGRCSFQDRFLVVRGDIRTYKIHLGSGNILMEPNDQYLCIVPSQSVSKKGDNIFLPFEGDKLLSIVLSKAILLAGDTKIKDPTIVSQIKC